MLSTRELRMCEREKRGRLESAEMAKRRLMEISIKVKLTIAMEKERGLRGRRGVVMPDVRVVLSPDSDAATVLASDMGLRQPPSLHVHGSRKHSGQSSSSGVTTDTTQCHTNSSYSPLLVASPDNSLMGSPHGSPAGSPGTKSILMSRNRSASPRSSLFRKVSFSTSSPIFACSVLDVSSDEQISSPEDLPLLPR